jgi:excisionase family DNA binding protein
MKEFQTIETRRFPLAVTPGAVRPEPGESLRVSFSEGRKIEWRKSMEPFLTPDEVAKNLKVSRVWVYKLCDQGRIPFFRLAGKVIRFRQEEIEQWIEAGRGGKYHRDKKTEREVNHG